MNKSYPFETALRCHAMSKRTRKRCQAPAVSGWKVCRLHGAGGGAPKGSAHGRYRHGLFTREAIQERRRINAILRDSKRMLATIEKGIGGGF
jgi:hypothetical protein